MSSETTPNGSQSRSPAQIVADAFMPYAAAKLKLVRESDLSFAHYTTAESAAKIIQSKSFFLRSPRLMNDWSEIRHGRECWKAMWEGQAGETLRDTLDSVDPSIVAEFEKIADVVKEVILDTGFLGSVSEHDMATDSHGRLSMWRAYGATSGVALVLNKAGFTGSSVTTNLLSAPVQYVTPDEYATYMLSVADGIKRVLPLYRQIPQQQQHLMLLMVYIFSLVSLKHKGFSEEREWRILHLPMLSDYGLVNAPSPSQISKPILTLGGQPQRVAVLHFEGLAAGGLPALAPNLLIEGVTVGPAAFPVVTGDALEALMTDSGILNAKDRIGYSLIPVRTDR